MSSFKIVHRQQLQNVDENSSESHEIQNYLIESFILVSGPAGLGVCCMLMYVIFHNICMKMILIWQRCV